MTSEENGKHRVAMSNRMSPATREAPTLRYVHSHSLSLSLPLAVRASARVSPAIRQFLALLRNQHAAHRGASATDSSDPAHAPQIHKYIAYLLRFNIKATNPIAMSQRPLKFLQESRQRLSSGSFFPS